MITHTVLRLGRSCRSRRAGARSACMRTSFRVERDSMGEIKVPAEALWGAHTQRAVQNFPVSGLDRKSTRLNSSHSQISYAVFCLKKKKKQYWRRTRWIYGSAPLALAPWAFLAV